MSEFMEKIKELYEEKKDLENPPSYIYTIKQILAIDSNLNQEEKNKDRINMQT